MIRDPDRYPRDLARELAAAAALAIADHEFEASHDIDRNIGFRIRHEHSNLACYVALQLRLHAQRIDIKSFVRRSKSTCMFNCAVSQPSGTDVVYAAADIHDVMTGRTRLAEARAVDQRISGVDVAVT